MPGKRTAMITLKPIRFAMASALLAWGAHATTAQAAEFHMYVKCKGTLSASGKSKPAHLDLALRDNNTTALIQRSWPSTVRCADTGMIGGSARALRRRRRSRATWR